MAAAKPVKAIKDEVTCSICLELFRDPVTTECGHSFCEPCITRHCEGRDFDIACPRCKRTFHRKNLRPNWELKNIVDAVNQLSVLQGKEEAGGVPKCEKHQEPLKLYCKNDQSPLCVVCRESWLHRTHIVVPIEEVVQQYRKTLRKHLETVESNCEKLLLFMDKDWKHIPQSAREEEFKRLKGLTEKLAITIKAQPESQRQRFEERASQPEAPEWNCPSPGREQTGGTELQGQKGREPGSEPAAETQEETGSHVVHVCEEAPTPKYGLDQATLDPEVHSISSRRDFEEFKVNVKSLRSRFEKPTSAAPSEVHVGKQKNRVSPAGQGATQTELGGHTGPGGEAPEEQEATETHVSEKAAPWKRAARRNPQRYSTIGVISELSQADVKSLIKSFQDQTSVKPGMGPGGSRQVGVSAVPMRGAARGHAGPGGEAPEKQGETETRVHEEAETPRPVPRRKPQRHSTIGGADAPSRGDSLQDLTLAGAARESGGSGQVGVSPGGRVARPPDIQGCAVEVTLDPATAHPRLVLSEDRKSAELRDTWQDLPNTPERFDSSVCVLGSEGFTSGRRYWEVEVEVGPWGDWAIGVARDSVQRKGKIQWKPDLGIWALVSFNILQVPRKVGVYLDYEGGQVRFYNAETMALISSRTATFTGRLVPFFRLRAVGSHLTLSLCQR